jgi:Domain of unknown function (DUF3854)
MSVSVSVPADRSISAHFFDQVQQEFIQGSAIAPALFSNAIALVQDTEVTAGNDVSYPIHDALNWKISRFGQQARSTLHAALFQNEDASTWQAKLSVPIADPKKGKPRKYETPVGSGSRAFFPNLDPNTRSHIQTRYQTLVPPNSSVWDWLKVHPEVPIVLTEGGKKGLSLLTQGYLGIALYGVNGGYRSKDELGEPCTPYLIPDLAALIQPGRPVYLAFDQDAAIETNQAVARAISRFGAVLAKAGAIVYVIQWNGADGKGCDDLIVNRGPEAFQLEYDRALPLEEWKIEQYLRRQLTYDTAQIVHAADLSTVSLEHLPQDGIWAIASPKGTGKTKFIAANLPEDGKVALATHRVCLGRNLCQRLNIHWRNDLDKVHGEFIAGDGYTLRVGFCVDALLAIDPTKFQGCTLVIDEAVQVFRHLLLSSTCRKGGKLAALLDRLKAIIQTSKLIILADADLDDATLDYVSSLREVRKPIYLIRNDIEVKGYPTDFIEATNPSGTIVLLNKAVESGQRTFVTIDSKAGSLTLKKNLEKLGAKVFLINSETSGGEEEQRFITNPDRFLAHDPTWDVVIATPSLCTGVSIESNYFQQVFGIFYGVIPDADMAQGLGRIRQPIPRTVWCAQRGIDRGGVSDSVNPLVIKTALQQRTQAISNLLWNDLTPDAQENLTNYDWQGDPHLNLWARISASTHRSMQNLRSALKVRLRYEGNQVKVIDLETDPVAQEQLKNIRRELKEAEAKAIANAPMLSPTERVALENQESLSPQERLSLEKTILADFYGLTEAELTPEVVLKDKQGRRRQQLLALENQLASGLCQERDLKGLERQVAWGKGLCAWDIGTSTLQHKIREYLGLHAFIDRDRSWTKYDLIELGDCAKHHRKEIKSALNFTITDTMSAVQIAHQLLEQLGIPVKQRCWSTKAEGHEGEKLRIYGVDALEWDEIQVILSRRRARRQGSATAIGSPLYLNNLIENGGDPECFEFTYKWEEERVNLSIDLEVPDNSDAGDPIGRAA